MLRRHVLLRGTSGPKREEVAGDWRRLHNEELHNLYTSPNVIRVIKSGRMRWAGEVARIGEIQYNILVGQPGGKKIIGRHRHRWEDNIRIDLRKIGWQGVDLVHLAQNGNQWRAVVNTVMKLQVT
jgi:hypothetical protein